MEIDSRRRGFGLEEPVPRLVAAQAGRVGALRELELDACRLPTVRSGQERHQRRQVDQQKREDARQPRRQQNDEQSRFEAHHKHRSRVVQDGSIPKAILCRIRVSYL